MSTAANTNTGTNNNLQDLLEEQEQRLAELDQELSKIPKTSEAIKSFFKKASVAISELPKARAAKAIRHWVDSLSQGVGLEEEEGDSVEAQLTLCHEAIEWATTQKRTFLRHRVELRLGWFYLEYRQLGKAGDLLETLIAEVRKLDEKILLVEAYLLQARTYYEVKAIAKAKASLTACRTNSNSVHVQPALQAEIEFTAGVLAAAESDFRVAHSYFLESFDALIHCKVQNNIGMTTRERATAFLTLSKLMDNRIKEFWALVSSRTILPYTETPLVKGLMAIAKALEKENLGVFNDAINDHPCLSRDVCLYEHIQDLQSKMLEDCILSTLRAYSRLDMGYIAKVLSLPVELIQQKITELILDERLQATVDEESQIITTGETPKDYEHLEDAVSSVQHLSECADLLHLLAQKLY